MDARDRYRGALLGLAAGDALGTTAEFCPPGTFTPLTDMTGGGTFRLAAGQWTDDTSLALCLAESLVVKQGFDPVDQVERYVRWRREGYLSSNGTCVDIGNTVRAALERFERTHEPYCGSTDPATAGNGSIMRLAPVPLFFARDPKEAVAKAGDSSRTTHGAQACVDACRYLAALIVGALQGASKEQLLSERYEPVPGLWAEAGLMADIDAIAGGSFKRRNPPDIKGTGYVVASLEAALWAFYHGESFREGALLAANLGDDADTTAAVYGQLAGAYYGASGIPEEWRAKLALRDKIVQLADELLQPASASASAAPGRPEAETPAATRAGPIDNTGLLAELLQRRQINMLDDAWLSRPPAPLPEGLDFDRVEGMLLGLAIGDALGNTSESQLPQARQARYGEIRDYLPNRWAGGEAVGLPSDDTQMAFWTLEQLLADGGLVPDHLAQRFCLDRILGIGGIVKAFLRAYKEEHVPWVEAGGTHEAAGNGAVMRIAPVLVPHLRHPAGLWADAALAGMITHNDRASNAACVAFVHLLWETLRLAAAPEPEWWLHTFCAVMARLEGETNYSPRARGSAAYAGPIWRYTAGEVAQALEHDLSVVAACNRWYSGAYLMETLPCTLYILARHGGDPEEALVRAVNDTKDNDTVAALVGAAVGALHGKRGLPERWVRGLLGRTGANDDGRVQALIAQARQAFASGP